MAAKAQKAKGEKAKSTKKKSGILNQRCPTCKKTFATAYSKKRHQRKKFGFSKKAVKEREAKRKERRQSQNKAYYLRRKWGISLAADPLPGVLDALLSKIPGSSVVVTGRRHRVRRGRMEAPTASETELEARLKALNDT